jgi:uncharacterized repeat protein (TIGR03803 family)
MAQKGQSASCLAFAMVISICSKTPPPENIRNLDPAGYDALKRAQNILRGVAMKFKMLLAFLFLPLLGSAQTYTYSTLVSFPPQAQKGPNDPGPFAPLIIDAAGNLYGTTQYGGTHGPSYGDGTVFKVTAEGKLSVLHSFDGNDGQEPWANVVRDSAGNLYGTTMFGGTHGLGTVFKLTPGGKETVLHSFAGGTDGNDPFDPVTLDASGNLYGYTFLLTDGSDDLGKIYEITKDGTFSIVFDFNPYDGGDGYNPNGNLTLGKDGNFYGTTLHGGSTTGAADGTVFRLTPQHVFTLLYAFPFTFPENFQEPSSPLTQDAEGNLFGLINIGLDNVGLFEITPSAEVSIVTSCCVGGDRLVHDKAGNMFGIASTAGGSTPAFIYEVTTAGLVTTLYTFPETVQANLAGLTIDAAGNLYGTTGQGGTNSTGSVFKLTKSGD